MVKCPPDSRTPATRPSTAPNAPATTEAKVFSVRRTLGVARRSGTPTAACMMRTQKKVTPPITAPMKMVVQNPRGQFAMA